MVEKRNDVSNFVAIPTSFPLTSSTIIFIASSSQPLFITSNTPTSLESGSGSK